MHFRIRIRIGGSIPERGSEGDRRRPSLFQEATAAAAECVKCEQDGVFVQLQSAEVGERERVCGVDWSGIAGKRSRERERGYNGQNDGRRNHRR